MLRRREDARREAPPPTKPPTAEDFSDQAVKRAVLSDVLVSPITFPPSAGGAGLLVWGLLFGFSPAVALLAIFCLSGGAIGAVYNWYFRAGHFAERYVQRKLEERKLFRESQVEDIEGKCEEVGFDAGAKEARELQAAYQTLRSYLEDGADGNHRNLQQFLALTEDVYFEGLHHLQTALEIYRALQDVDVGSLESELRRWEKELGKLQDASDSKHKPLEEKIASHRQRIETYRTRENEIEVHLTESDKRESILEQVRLRASELDGAAVGNATSNDGGALNELTLQLKAAIDAEQTVRALGSGTRVSPETIARYRKRETV